MVTFGDKVYSALFDPIPQAVIVLDEGCIAFANDAAASMLGGRDACIGSPIERFLDVGPFDLSSIAGAALEPVAFQATMARPDGARRRVEVDAEPFTIGSERHIRLILADAEPLTPRADVGGEFATSRRDRDVEWERRALFQALPDHFLRLDSHGTILEYNAPENASPFLAPSTFLGRRLHEILPIEYTDLVSEALESAIDTHRTQAIEFELPIEATSRSFEARIVPYTAELLIAIVRDVTDRKRHEEQALLAHKLESIERLAGGIAHDFNNLLTAIVAYAELALLELPEEATAARHLRPILSATQRASDLTRKLLAFSRRHVGEVTRVDVAGLVRGFGNVVRIALGADVALSLRIDSNAGELTVLADPRLLEKAIFNLVVNAREAMEHGGTLTVAVRRVTVGPVFADRHFGLKRGEYAAIYLHDTGHGMDDATLKRAFDPFFSTRRNGEGRGLGLPTSHGIVRQLGGHVIASSRPGRGTLVAIYIPLASARSVSAPEAPSRSPGDHAGSVLVVEDEIAVREIVSHALRSHGYRVVAIENGRAALDWIHANGFDFDLVVTDVVMPQMGGRELVEHLRRERPALRVLFMSGYTASALEAADLATPGTGFLQKPFTPAVLAEQVSRLVTS